MGNSSSQLVGEQVKGQTDGLNINLPAIYLTVTMSVALYILHEHFMQRRARQPSDENLRTLMLEQIRLQQLEMQTEINNIAHRNTLEIMREENKLKLQMAIIEIARTAGAENQETARQLIGAGFQPALPNTNPETPAINMTIEQPQSDNNGNENDFPQRILETALNGVATLLKHPFNSSA